MTTVAETTVPVVKAKEEFRKHTDCEERQSRVEEFYKEQHTKMTYDFVLKMEEKYLGLTHFHMGIWEILEYLDTFVDDSDPDTDASQMQHALQTAESLRAMYPGEQYDWMHLTGLIHDIGKILSVACNEPQFCVVGDTFPVGCAFSPSIVFHKYFASNPDTKHDVYSTELGVYERGCGLSKVHMSFGHDEYLYQVVTHAKNGPCKLPLPALYMIRFHSFYPWHDKLAYDHLLDQQDRDMFQWIKKFNAHDLYSKAHAKQDVEALKPYYQGLIKKYFPEKLYW